MYLSIYFAVNNNTIKNICMRAVHNKKFVKTNMLSYGKEATGFQDKEIPKAGSDYTNLA